jgi:hypothetical protein
MSVEKQYLRVRLSRGQRRCARWLITSTYPALPQVYARFGRWLITPRVHRYWTVFFTGPLGYDAQIRAPPAPTDLLVGRPGWRFSPPADGPVKISSIDVG